MAFDGLVLNLAFALVASVSIITTVLVISYLMRGITGPKVVAVNVLSTVSFAILVCVIVTDAIFVGSDLPKPFLAVLLTALVVLIVRDIHDVIVMIRSYRSDS